jgi:hypothetical protein
MEYPGLHIIDENRCDFLRWKGMFVENIRDPNVQPSNDRLFWCAKTETCLGPDGKLADDYECNGARRCFRPL